MADKVMAALWAISVVAWLALLLGSRHAKRRTDSLTGVYGVEYFYRYVRRLIEKKKEFHLVTLELRQLKKINRLRGTHCGRSAAGVYGQSAAPDKPVESGISHHGPALHGAHVYPERIRERAARGADDFCSAV